MPAGAPAVAALPLACLRRKLRFRMLAYLQALLCFGRAVAECCKAEWVGQRSEWTSPADTNACVRTCATEYELVAAAG